MGVSHASVTPDWSRGTNHGQLTSVHQKPSNAEDSGLV